MTDQLVTGTFAGRYEITGEIGQGAAAVVYAATDLKHGRRVALKVLRPEVSRMLGQERFLAEIRIAASFSHPHIIPLHDSGRAEGLLYYVMPLVEGESLRARLERQRQLPLEEVLAIAADVAEGLEYAHRHGVIHRDIKPENILFLGGHAAIADFGVARAMRRPAEGTRTDPGVLLGTPAYMSPEASGGGTDVDARSDQYSLACVLYESLAGNPPFVAADVRAVIARHLFDAVPPLATVRPDLPPGIGEVLTRALAKTPADRFPSCQAFLEALREAAAGHEVAAAQSIAVLPFENSSELPEDEALADGITDEIMGALARVPGLRVASRTSAYALRARSQDAQAIAARLHVRAILEGSVRRAGNRLRIAVQLVGAREGYLLWSERYDRELQDVFAIQDEIAQNVARALRLILGDRRPAIRPATQDMRAYEYYLRGRQYFRQSRRKSLQYAREMFERAVTLDPGFAAAWAGVANACSTLHMYYPGSDADLSRADEASATALALAPDLADAHAARGFVLWRLDRLDEAGPSFETAMRLDPKQFEARYFYARLCFQRGEMERAAALFEEAARAQEDYQARFFAAQAFAALGRKADAEAAYRRALHVVEEHLELNPDDPRAATMRAVSLCRLGRPRDGLAWAERARAIDPDDAGVLYNVACLYALEGQGDTALDCLEGAVAAGFGDREWFTRDPDLESLREHPRFKALLQHE